MESGGFGAFLFVSLGSVVTGVEGVVNVGFTGDVIVGEAATMGSIVRVRFVGRARGTGLRNHSCSVLDVPKSLEAPEVGVRGGSGLEA